MRIHDNGSARDLPDRTSLRALVPAARGVAVALNGAVVRAAEWERTTLCEGDLVEVVTAHQGG